MCGDNEAYSKFRLPEGKEGDDFEIFPGLIDSCFQLVAATFFDNVGGSTYIPFQVDSFVYYKKPDPTQPLWCHAKERGRSGDAQVLHSDVNLFCEDGSLVMAVVDLHLKKAGGKALIERVADGPQQSMYDFSWIQVPMADDTPLVDEDEAATWLVFGAEGKSDYVADFVADEGHECVQVRSFWCEIFGFESFGPRNKVLRNTVILCKTCL